VQHILPDGKVQHPADGAFDKAMAVPTLFTQLVVGCRRKIVIYSWRDGEAQDVRVWHLLKVVSVDDIR
jgi:Vam6/Vps39-like protein vacuolar protein sorting-associated protein 39